MGFTPEQDNAIKSRGENLLVSAAAGSGKTTVLVERIIQRVLDEEKPVDIDRFLVMTFTSAAAEQMKNKILAAIDERRAKDPANRHLIRQSSLVHNARISTIHGFCLNVIKDHFGEIGLDPDFRIADEGECKLLKHDVIQKVIERSYEEGSEEFLHMSECIASGKSDHALEEILDKLYIFSQSTPDPIAWLDKCAGAYDVQAGTEPEWFKYVLDTAKARCEEIYKHTLRACDICLEPDGPYLYLENTQRAAELADALRNLKTYDEYRNALMGIDFGRLPRQKKDDPYVDPTLKKLYDTVRDDIKYEIRMLREKIFNLPIEQQLRRIDVCRPVVCELVRLTQEITEDYSKLKREKKILDFNDLEHMCIGILGAGDGNTAREYRDYFEEIYVDEYQDSNMVQEELLKYITRGDNLFMVGDVKQSIYSFRLARPQLFMEKYDSYKKDPGKSSHNRRIDLSYNFRSRSGVLNSVNELFSQIMHKDFGGIEYDDAAALHLGSDYPAADEEQGKTELLLVDYERGGNQTEIEAKAIAMRIRSLMRDQMIFDPTEDEPKRMRRIKYSDIVILLRSAKGYEETIKKVIEQEGIPVHTMSSTGYFAAMEVSVLLDYLRVLDNPLQDIPMTAVLRSSLGGFSDDELADMRIRYPERYVYDSLRKYTDNKKSAAFLERFEKMRLKTGYTPVYELLLELIDGDYGSIISALPDGARKMANLNMLLKKAEDYGRLSYKGLFNFIRYIEMLKKHEVDYGEANIPDENDDAVRIMTIHKSKGLEFPVCFVAGLYKGYNFHDVRQSVIPDIDIGLGINLIDPEKRIKQPTLIKNLVRNKKSTEMHTEEARVLYVAMTRAKEKLILTAAVSGLETHLSRPRMLSKCDSFFDLIAYALNGAGLPSVSANILSAADLIEADIRDTVHDEVEKEEIRRIMRGADVPDNDMIRDRFSFVYSHDAGDRIFEKVSVTELKRRSMHEVLPEDKELPDQRGEPVTVEETLPYIPDFIREQEKEIPATLHGTAVHRIFEIWDYDRDGSDAEIQSFMEYVREKGLMEDELVGCVRIPEVSGFLNSDLAARMKAAYKKGQLYREQPFMISHGDIIIQGIIDAYFIEDDKIVIVDYKTDRVADVNELKERYHVQLEYYAKALSTLLDKPVSQMLIYSTRHNKTVAV
ncbi:MAG: helicase-exonuclease AddAB subunit AddA [Lachnospiraceae bacterium]|nr:helicase-exonuclease AddAB subunit AddA [Lachnospiraceae bacterium]